MSPPMSPLAWSRVTLAVGADGLAQQRLPQVEAVDGDPRTDLGRKFGQYGLMIGAAVGIVALPASGSQASLYTHLANVDHAPGLASGHWSQPRSY